MGELVGSLTYRSCEGFAQKLAHAALELHNEHYPPFNSPNISPYDFVYAQAVNPATELGTAKLAFHDNVMVGFFAAFPLSELSDRQLANLKVQMDLAPTAAVRSELLAHYREQMRQNLIQPIDVEDCFYLSRIYVLPAFQGYGFGRQIMRQCYLDAEAAKCRKLSLHVLTTNQRACAFYKHLGFNATSEEQRFVFRAFTHSFSGAFEDGSPTANHR